MYKGVKVPEELGSLRTLLIANVNTKPASHMYWIMNIICQLNIYNCFDNWIEYIQFGRITSWGTFLLSKKNGYYPWEFL